MRFLALSLLAPLWLLVHLQWAWAFRRVSRRRAALGFLLPPLLAYWAREPRLLRRLWWSLALSYLGLWLWGRLWPLH